MWWSCAWGDVKTALLDFLLYRQLLPSSWDNFRQVPLDPHSSSKWVGETETYNKKMALVRTTLLIFYHSESDQGFRSCGTVRFRMVKSIQDRFDKGYLRTVGILDIAWACLFYMLKRAIHPSSQTIQCDQFVHLRDGKRSLINLRYLPKCGWGAICQKSQLEK